MARASEYTLLSLDRYAKIMGINPLHFAGAQTPGLTPQVFPDVGCDSIWFQYDWQYHDQVSREQIARAIKDAEDSVMNVIGFPPAPMWVDSEVHKYPRNAVIGSLATVGVPTVRSNRWRTEFGSWETVDVEGRPKSINARWAKFIIGGQRTLATVGEATVDGGELVYTDEDSDGFYETATITLALPATMTSLTDACEFKVFFDGETAPAWEIRYPRSATITGGNIVFVFDSWMFIDPDLWEQFPTSDGVAAIDVSDTTNFVTTVDVYREYADHTEASSTFYWDNSRPNVCTTSGTSTCTSCGGVGCEVCSYTAQTGCLIARDVNLGILVPQPATYDTDNSVWLRTNYAVSARPDMVKIWYKAGDQSQDYLNCRTCDPMSNFWAQIVSWIATARLERPLCSCGNLQALSEKLREDLSRFSRAEATHYQTDDIINCPFGTLRGEVEAWRRIKKTFRDKSKKLSVAII